MAMQIIVTDVQKNPNAVSGVKDSERIYTYVLIENLQNMQVFTGYESQVVGTVFQIKAVPMNFSIKGNSIVEDWGKFDRLKAIGGIQPVIILAELTSESDRVLGYYVFRKDKGVVSAIKRETFLQNCKTAKSRGVALAQNAIYRVTNGVEQIAAFEGHTFPKRKQTMSKKVQPAQPQMPVTENKPVKPKQPVPQPVKQASTPQPVQPKNEYTEAQKKEMIAAKQNGVDPAIISSPKFSPEQMRILWTAKRNGVASEYFANPKFSVEQMQFFAERLIDRKVFMDCKAIIHPEYDVDQLAELYQGIYDGVDYTIYLDSNLTAEEMYVERMKLESSQYCDILLGSSGSDGESVRKFFNKVKSSKASS